MPWKYHTSIFDVLNVNSEATIVLTISSNDTLTKEDWDQIEQYDEITHGSVKVALINSNDYKECIKRDIPFFFINSISEPWMLNAVVNMGVCAARVTGELTHDLDYLKNLPIEIRVFANQPGAPFDYNPLIGGWFRPEDLYKLDAIDVCEFSTENIQQEQALYRIYAEQKEWPGRLDIIIKNLNNENIYNRMLPPDFQERRSNCSMRCQRGGYCRYCNTIVNLANPDLLRPIKEKLENV